MKTAARWSLLADTAFAPMAASAARRDEARRYSPAAERRDERGVVLLVGVASLRSSRTDAVVRVGRVLAMC